MSAETERRKKAALACAKKLDAAHDALGEFMTACNACQDESASATLRGKGIDGRDTLRRDLSEYAEHLRICYEKRGAP